MKKIIFISLFFIFSCSSDIIDLDNNEKNILNYSQLPEEAKKLYSFKAINGDYHNVYKDCFSNNEKFEIHEYTITSNDKLITFLSEGFHHIITINDKKFKIDIRKGRPFVLIDKNLFYSKELNLDEKNLKSSKFVRIDLSDYLK